MKHNDHRYTVCAILLLIACTFVQVLAQTPTRLGPASDAEINKAFAVVEANMDSLKAHQKYIYAKGMGNPELWDQYDLWMKKYPDNVNIPLAIGTIYNRASMPQPKDFLQRAAVMNPKNAKIWYMLAMDADLAAQNDLLTEYIGKASAIEPANAGYAYGYLKSLKNSNPETYEQKVFDFVKRFPEDERSAAAIYDLAKNARDLNQKIRYYEELRKLYPPQKFRLSASGMVALTDAYLETNPEKAITIIDEMGEGGDWKLRKQLAQSIIEIGQLEQAQKYREAGSKLNQLKLPRFNYIADFIALKKASLQEKGGDAKGAYDSLAVKFAKLPTDALYNAMELYGKKIGKDKKQVDKDIETIRNHATVPAHPFQLGLYTSNEKLDLNALKGKVILLTFWFPACGPCREEFPHFQTVMDSFKGDSVVYLGVNVLPSQDGFVLPFMKNTKYSFIPLRGSNAFAEEKFGAIGQPANFVIDKEGKIVFKDFRIDESNQRTLELMIASLL